MNFDFVEAPVRFLNQEVNGNTAGLGDMNAGLKVALVQGEDGLVTFQFRTWFPTGAASRGLGTRHVSLEPALLFNYQLAERWRLEGELRYWAAVGGQDVPALASALTWLGEYFSLRASTQASPLSPRTME